MALVTRRNGNGQVTSAMVPPELVDTFRTYGPLLKDWADARGKRSASMRARTNKSMGRKGDPGRTRNPSGPSGSSVPGTNLAFGGPARVIPNANELRASFTDMVDFANGASGSPAYLTFALGANNNSSSVFGLFASNGPMARANAMALLFRQFKINSLIVRFVPTSGYTTGGSLAMAIDPDPSAGAAVNYASCIRHRVNTFGDVKSPSQLTYRPTIDYKRDPRYVFGGTNKDDDEKAFGVFQSWSTNSATANTSLGTLMFILDVTFIGPC